MLTGRDIFGQLHLKQSRSSTWNFDSLSVVKQAAQII